MTDDAPPGCLTIPLLAVVVPVRLLWEVLATTGRLARARVLRPLRWLLIEGLVRPLVWAAGELVLRPLGWALRVLVLLPLRWALRDVLVPGWRLLLRRVLRPVAAGVAWGAALLAAGLVRAARWTGRALALLSRAVWRPLGRLLLAPLAYVAVRLGRVAALLLRPLAYAGAWLARGIAALGRTAAAVLGTVAAWAGRGLAALWRAVLWPLLTAFGRLLVVTWRLAGLVLFVLFVWPLRLVWRTVCRSALRAVRRAWRATVVPAARGLRDHAWEPARAAGRSLTRALGLDTRRP